MNISVFLTEQTPPNYADAGLINHFCDSERYHYVQFRDGILMGQGSNAVDLQLDNVSLLTLLDHGVIENWRNQYKRQFDGSEMILLQEKLTCHLISSIGLINPNSCSSIVEIQVRHIYRDSDTDYFERLHLNRDSSLDFYVERNDSGEIIGSIGLIDTSRFSGANIEQCVIWLVLFCYADEAPPDWFLLKNLLLERPDRSFETVGAMKTSWLITRV